MRLAGAGDRKGGGGREGVGGGGRERERGWGGRGQMVSTQTEDRRAEGRVYKAARHFLCSEKQRRFPQALVDRSARFIVCCLLFGFSAKGLKRRMKDGCPVS